jgi:hypothetical protein
MCCHSVGCGTHTRAVDPVSESTFAMILRPIIALFPLTICILVVVLAYRKTQDR